MGKATTTTRPGGQIAVFAKAVSYVIYLTLPVHAAMMVVGFLHKVRGLPYMTSAKLSGFFTPSPLVIVANQLILFLLSAFE